VIGEEVRVAVTSVAFLVGMVQRFVVGKQLKMEGFVVRKMNGPGIEQNKK
jgi:hypothetical protein